MGEVSRRGGEGVPVSSPLYLKTAKKKPLPEKLPGSGIDFDRFGQVRGDYCRGPISFMKAA